MDVGTKFSFILIFDKHKMAAASTTKKKLEDILTCCLCFELYNTREKVPKALPCQHTFCAPCLDEHMQTADKNREEYKCSTCKGKLAFPHQVVSDLPTNFTVFGLLELKLLQKTSSEERNKQEFPMCDIHTDKQSMFACMDCFVGLCGGCIKTLSKGVHNLHKLEEIETVFTKQKVSLDEFKEHTDALDRHIAETHNEFKNHLRTEQKHLCREVNKNAELLIKHLNISNHRNKRWSANMSKRAKVTSQQIRTWQNNTKVEIKEQLDSKEVMLADTITNLRNHSDDIKIKIGEAETLPSFPNLLYIKVTKTLAAALQKLEMQHQELKENTSRWELVVSTQCDKHLSLTVADQPSTAHDVRNERVVLRQKHYTVCSPKPQRNHTHYCLVFLQHLMVQIFSTFLLLYFIFLVFFIVYLFYSLSPWRKDV